MPEEMHHAGHRRPRPGSQLGHKSEIALLLIADAGGQRVGLRDITAAQRHYVNSKAHVLEQMALIVCHNPDADAADGDGRPTYSLTDLGLTAVELIRSAATA